MGGVFAVMRQVSCREKRGEFPFVIMNMHAKIAYNRVDSETPCLAASIDNDPTFNIIQHMTRGKQATFPRTNPSSINKKIHFNKNKFQLIRPKWPVNLFVGDDPHDEQVQKKYKSINANRGDDPIALGFGRIKLPIGRPISGGC